MVDPHDQMETTRPKWSKIASELILNGHSPLQRSGMAFKPSDDILHFAH